MPFLNPDSLRFDLKNGWKGMALVNLDVSIVLPQPLIICNARELVPSSERASFPELKTEH